MGDPMFDRFASVVIDKGPPAPLDYGIPGDMTSRILPGVRVSVLLRGKRRIGTVTRVHSASRYTAVQPILSVEQEGLLPSDLIQLSEWMVSYYLASSSAVLRSVLPSFVRREVKQRQELQVRPLISRVKMAEWCAKLRSRAPAQAALLETLIRHAKGISVSELLKLAGVSRAALGGLAQKKLVAVQPGPSSGEADLSHADFFKAKPKALSAEQSQALEAIENTLESGVYAAHLLYGITGSGKTEVYLRAAEQALAMGFGVIVLVPEIALTEQTVQRFRSRFDEPLAVLHHRLSDGERCDLWQKIRSGEIRVVVGPRSAIFSPVKALRLIIVDEEHDASYKQSEQSPCYHGRDVAVMRAHLTNSTVLLGSATPSLETYANALSGKYNLLTLSARADSAHLPVVRMVDMRKKACDRGGFVLLSDALLTAIQKRYEAGEQSLLFLNRRGYFSMQMCSSCGQALGCPNCDVSLTFHRGANLLSCHLCDYSLSPPPRRCPSCSACEPLTFKGAGTEQVEAVLRRVFPEIRTLRIDADTTRKKGSHQTLLRTFRSGKADVLIGTQMVAKGLHFSQVTLVGVIHGDSGLNFPDFRASEHAFQMLTQVAGRSGRGPAQGEVLIQTFKPDNETLKLAASQDYKAFFEQEVRSRKLFGFPPYSQMIKITFSGEERALVEQAARQIHSQVLRHLPSGCEAFPVLPCGYPRINQLYRFQFLLRGPSIALLGGALSRISLTTPSGVRMLVDINPTTTFS